jgi:ketosteroid isomerase-like protein
MTLVPLPARRRRRRVAALSALLLSLAAVAGCRYSNAGRVSASQRAAISDTLRALIVSAYDLSRPGDAVARLMSLYPTTGDVVSASGGQVSTSRDSLEAGIRAFWENVGRNMRDPKWTWGPMHVDVLSPDAAVLTTTYRVPHLTPRGDPHVIAGAWTALFERRGGRWVIVQEHLSDMPQAMTAANMQQPMPAADQPSTPSSRAK